MRYLSVLISLVILSVLFSNTGFAQSKPDKVYASEIHSVLIHPFGKPLALPVINLNAANVLLISFDDFKAEYQDYYYSVELVDSAWNPIDMNEFDYIKGFNQNKITDFSASSIAVQKYFHYQFSFPNSYCSPKLSGNYILKVYRGGNKRDLIFTRRFFVTEDIVSVAASVHEPFDGELSRSHQKIKISVDVKAIPSFQPDQLKVKVIQNFRYNSPQTVSAPSFLRNTVLEFNNESELIFPGGNEARWLDIQSLKLKSDRIAEIDAKSALATIIVKPDVSRSNMMYASFNDLNGGYLIMNTESLQSENQNDYARVLFTYLPKDQIPFLDQRLYLTGALTNNDLNTESEMLFDTKLGVYQKTLLLKQGYYSYNYILRDRNNPNEMDDYMDTEGNHWETENNYGVFIYYHAPGTRYDQIVGFSSINSKQNW